MKHVLEYAVLANVLLCIGYFALYGVFVHRLRTRYPLQWEALQKPTLFSNNSAASTWATFVFFFKGDITRLHQCDRYTVYFLRASLLLVFALLLLFTIGIILGV